MLSLQMRTTCMRLRKCSRLNTTNFRNYTILYEYRSHIKYGHRIYGEADRRTVARTARRATANNTVAIDRADHSIQHEGVLGQRAAQEARFARHRPERNPAPN